MLRKVDDYAVFKRAHVLTLEVYRLTRQLPKEETYGLVSQMRRAAYSIPMNLKEGSAGSTSEFARYVRITIGSKEEVEYQLMLAKDLGYITKEQCKKLSGEVAEIGKMLYSLLRKLSSESDA
jgi:four helix bundle protein